MGWGGVGLGEGRWLREEEVSAQETRLPDRVTSLQASNITLSISQTLAWPSSSQLSMSHRRTREGKGGRGGGFQTFPPSRPVSQAPPNNRSLFTGPVGVLPILLSKEFRWLPSFQTHLPWPPTRLASDRRAWRSARSPNIERHPLPYSASCSSNAPSTGVPWPGTFESPFSVAT